MRFLLGITLVLWLAACNSEPAIVATLPPRPTPNPTGEALALSSAEQTLTETSAMLLGEHIFRQRCAVCHGETGVGDGATALDANLPMPDLSDPTRTEATTPATWLQIITEGRPDLMMPPWDASLNDNERLAVALYSYHLGGRTVKLKDFVP